MARRGGVGGAGVSGRTSTAAVPGPVAAAFATFPDDHQTTLSELRLLILDVAQEVGAAPVGEVLRWGQPSYLSARPRECTALRLASTADEAFVGLFVHCQSSVVRDFRSAFPDDFRYDGTRGILFEPGDDLQDDRLRLVIAHALQYRVAVPAHVQRA